jgi:hypothetical protein
MEAARAKPGNDKTAANKTGKQIVFLTSSLSFPWLTRVMTAATTAELTPKAAAGKNDHA